MNWLFELFNYPDNTQLLNGNYNLWLVALSVVIAILASTMALQISSQAAQFSKARLRQISTLVGAVSLGGGVWSMHFIGMLAFDLHTHVDYQWGLTLFSMLPSIAASVVALHLLGQGEISLKQLLIGGILVGSGIGTMHYTGMAAMQMGPMLHYHLGYFLLSIVCAVSLAMLALWVRFGLRKVLHAEMSEWALNLLGGIVMGTAISSMHYIGMAAARFISSENTAMAATGDSNSLLLALAITLTTMLITFSVVAINLTLKYRDISLIALASETRLRAMMDTAADGIVTITAEGIIINLNKMAEELFGWSNDEVVGRKVNMLMPSPYSSEHDNYLHNYLSTGEKKIIGTGREVQALHKDGHVVPIRLAVGHVQLPKENLFVAFVSDISERLQFEKELRLAKEVAENSAQTKSAFLANMSHEIRTPMNAIIGFGDLLLEEKLTTEQHKYLVNINKAAKSLLHLLNDILHSAKLEQGKLELEHSHFSVHELVDGVISTLWIQARHKGLELSFDLDHTLLEAYYGAPDRLRQVLINIIGNSIKFTEKGSVSLKVFITDDGMVQFSISDTGLGIAPDRLDKIFEPFTQADASMTRRFGGTGLGTSISKQLIELMGGSIWVNSTLGQGSCFEFKVPLPAGVKTVQENSTTTHLNLPKLHILITDDIQQNLDLLQLQLTKAGHTVVCATNGQEAVDKVEQEHFDLVLMDVQMPVMDGLTASQVIHERQAAQKCEATPIIALTASVDVGDRLAVKEAGMQGFASKPLDFKELCLEIARVLNIDISNSATASSQSSKTKTSVSIDEEKALQLWLSWPVYIAEIDKYIDESTEQMKKLQTLLSVNSFEVIAQLSHSQVGVCGNLALPILSKSFTKLETASKQKDLEKCHELADAIKDQLESLVESLTAIKNVHTKTIENSSHSLSSDELLSVIERLKILAGKNELDEALLATLNNAAQDSHNIVERITNAFDNFDFELAAELLHELEQSLNLESDHANS